MWGVVGILMNTFVLIRDVFVYLIPGAVLFGATVLTGLPQEIVEATKANVAFVPRPEWLKIVVLVAMAYALGHAIVALGYMAFVDRFKKPAPPPSEPLYYRYRYPSLYFEADREDIMADFRFGLCMSLAISIVILATAAWANWLLPVIVGGVGVILFLTLCRAAYTARIHVKQFNGATNEAAKTALTAAIPPEPRGAPNPKAD